MKPRWTIVATYDSAGNLLTPAPTYPNTALWPVQLRVVGCRGRRLLPDHSAFTRKKRLVTPTVGTGMVKDLTVPFPEMAVWPASIQLLLRLSVRQRV